MSSMVLPKAALFTVGIISIILIQTQGADKYTDGNRPYEFGFNIEGEQHRNEKKDENGLIMGEFGFITADGVYHVTVYATDEQGRFKILSMKNIRVKPYPTYKQSAGSPRQGHSLDAQTPQQTLPQKPSLTQKPEIPLKDISIEPPGRSCSSCSLPTTTTQAPIASYVQPNKQNVPFRQNPASVNPQYPNEAKTNSFANQQNTFNSQSDASPPELPSNQQNNNNPLIYSQLGPSSSQKIPNKEIVPPKYDTNTQNTLNGQYDASPPVFLANQQNNNNRQTSQPSPGSLQNRPNQEVVLPKQDTPDYYATGPQSSQPQGLGLDNNNTGGRTAKKYDGQDFNPGQAQQNKPTLISAQMQIVDKNTDIYQRAPGEKEGLPIGLTKGDMTQLLYAFNYTVGFHGHFEEGYRNGAKQGYYYITRRNGVRTRVDYVADDKGFRPKITQEVLDVLSEDVPKPETEKEEKYGLKGYEFKWLYYPAESNRR